LIFEGKYLEAQKLANAKATPKGNSGMPYQPVGNLVLTFPD
jgi:alpha-L-fucosidase 2